MRRRTFIKTTALSTAAVLSLAAAARVFGRADDHQHDSLVPAPRGLIVSKNGHYLADAASGRPFFLLSDTAWNLVALNAADLELYFASRRLHGFSGFMFCLDFYPQSSGLNAEGQCAYMGPQKDELNPKYFEFCDHLVRRGAHYGLYAMIVSMWAGKHSGIMNRYTTRQLHGIGVKLGRHFRDFSNVIHMAGGESTPPNINPVNVDALGRGLKAGCGGKHLITVHPCYQRSCSRYFARADWIDFYMSQGNSSKGGANYDMTGLVSHDYNLPHPRPTMIDENFYDSGTHQPPHMQRRGLYLSVFAGAFGCAYGHDALWEMTPHTGQPWMLKNWPPGVTNWREALNTPAVSDLHFIRRLLYSRPYFSRIPDQGLVLAGQDRAINRRIGATRDGSRLNRDATFLMAYLASPKEAVLNTGAIAGEKLNAYWFNPADGQYERIGMNFGNTGKLHLKKRAHGHDWVAVVDDAAKRYRPPGEV